MCSHPSRSPDGETVNDSMRIWKPRAGLWRWRSAATGVAIAAEMQARAMVRTDRETLIRIPSDVRWRAQTRGTARQVAAVHSADALELSRLRAAGAWRVPPA